MTCTIIAVTTSPTTTDIGNLYVGDRFYHRAEDMILTVQDFQFPDLHRRPDAVDVVCDLGTLFGARLGDTVELIARAS